MDADTGIVGCRSWNGCTTDSLSEALCSLNIVLEVSKMKRLMRRRHKVGAVNFDAIISQLVGVAFGKETQRQEIEV